MSKELWVYLEWLEPFVFVTKVYSRDACNEENILLNDTPEDKFVMKERTQKKCLAGANGIEILRSEKKRSLAPKMKRKCNGIYV